MPSKSGITAYLEKEDLKLFEKAVEKYGIGQSALIKEIIHAFLFQNKLQIETK